MNQVAKVYKANLLMASDLDLAFLGCLCHSQQSARSEVEEPNYLNGKSSRKVFNHTNLFHITI